MKHEGSLAGRVCRVCTELVVLMPSGHVVPVYAISLNPVPYRIDQEPATVTTLVTYVSGVQGARGDRSGDAYNRDSLALWRAVYDRRKASLLKKLSAAEGSAAQSMEGGEGELGPMDVACGAGSARSSSTQGASSEATAGTAAEASWSTTTDSGS